MLNIFFGNFLILVLAFLYWLLADYLYAKNFEFYHPYEWLINLSFLLFALISFDFTHKAGAGLVRRQRLARSLLVPAGLAIIFLLILNFFALELHLWVGRWLYP